MLYTVHSLCQFVLIAQLILKNKNVSQESSRLNKSWIQYKEHYFEQKFKFSQFVSRDPMKPDIGTLTNNNTVC